MTGYVLCENQAVSASCAPTALFCLPADSESVHWSEMNPFKHYLFFLNITTSESSVYPFLTRSASNNSWTISEIANWEKWAKEEKTERGVVFILNLNMPRATATKRETLTVDQVVSFMMGSVVIVANSWLKHIMFWFGVL